LKSVICWGEQEEEEMMMEEMFGDWHKKMASK
jgi:hypothetical protein